MSAKTRILIVEHNRHDIELVEYELKKGHIDYIAEVVQNEKEYMEALTRFIPDLILCDYSLPSFDGNTAFRIRESIVPETPFIFVSGALGELHSIEFVENGVTDYALKDKLFTLGGKVKRALKDFRERQQKDQTEKKLAANERKLARAQEIAHVGNWEVNFANDLFELSEEGCRIFGIPLDQQNLSFKNWTSLIHPEDLEELLQAIQENRDSTADSSYSHRILLKDGAIRHIYAEWKFEFDSAGKPTGLFGIIQDITDAKEAEAKLSKANRLYTFISHINQSIVHLKSEELLFSVVCRIALEYGKFVIAWIGMFDDTGDNISVVEQCGISREDLLVFSNTSCKGNGPQKEVMLTEEYFVCNDMECNPHVASWLDFTNEHGVHSVMALPIRKGGKVIGTFNLYAKEVNFFDTVEIELLEEVAGDISFAIEIFEKAKKQAETEERIVHNEKRFRALIEKSTDLETLMNSDMQFIYCSPSVTKVFGYTQEEFLHKTTADFFHQDDIPELLKKRKSF